MSHDEGTTLTRAEMRANELADAMTAIQQVLQAADATFAVQQTMVLAGDGTPRYAYTVQLVSK